MFIEAVFIKAKSWSQPDDSQEENTLWYEHAVECCPAA